MGAVKKESWCEIHPKSFALASGLCCHLDCIKKIVWSHAKGYKTLERHWTYINSLGAADDCCVFLVQKLLKDNQEQNKPMIINKSWLRFRLLEYINTGLRKSDLPMSRVPIGSKRKLYDKMVSIDALKEANSDLLDSMVFEGSLSFAAPTIDEEYEKKEMMTHIHEMFGDSVTLFITDEITKKEYVKLLGVDIAAALDYLIIAKRHIKHFLQEGEWLDNVVDEIQGWRQKYSVTLKRL